MQGHRRGKTAGVSAGGNVLGGGNFGHTMSFLIGMLWNDIRYALRLMRRSPGFTAVAVLSLALGIGAHTAIFSLFYTIMLRQLPVDHPAQLVELVRDSPEELHWPGYWAWDQYEYLRDHNHVFSGITGMGFDNLAELRTEGSDPETSIEESVPGNYFQVLGLKPAAGRLIGPEGMSRLAGMEMRR